MKYFYKTAQNEQFPIKKGSPKEALSFFFPLPPVYLGSGIENFI